MARNLQPVSVPPEPTRLATSLNVLVGEYNRPDRFSPITGPDTGTGAAYAITPTPGIKYYDIGQIFEFKAANASTSTAPTLNVNGFSAGTITDVAGSALVVGDIAANSWVQVVCTSTTPTFALLSIQPASFLRGPRPVLSSSTASLGSNVTLNNSTYTDGPTLTLGTGIWFVSGKNTINDSAGAVGIQYKLWDGTTIFDSGLVTTAGASFRTSTPASGVITNPAAAVRISCLASTNTAVMGSNLSGNGKDSTITAVRIG